MVDINKELDSKFDELGLKRLRESYMKDEEVSPQERFAFVAKKFGTNPDHTQRLYDYASNHWLSFSTPILSYGRSKRGLPISCFLNYLTDTAEGLVDGLSETNWLSMLGGGVGIHVRTRSADDKSTGVLPHLKVYDAASLAYRQGRTRRGSYAAYLDVSHPDVLQFLDIRKPTGDINLRCLNLHHGINITDDFMAIIERCMSDPDTDDSWSLVDPASNRVVEVVSAKHLWQSILETRARTGEPYLHFIDTANRHLNPYQKELGLKIYGSNLCSEIELPTSNDRTAVCCLSSLNLDYYDEYKDNQLFYDDVLEMLDNVLTVFIEDAPKELHRAVHSAIRERSVGVGVMGFHSYLQSKGIAFEGVVAKGLNIRIFKNIRERLDAANRRLGAVRGSPADIRGSGLRNTHVMAVAPTASSSIIMGNTSPSIEPFRANAYRQDTLSGSYTNKNRHLDKILKERLNVEEYEKAWSTIISNDGSVWSLDCLSDDEKYVFKTAMEIDQRWVIELAADRAQFIDQGQSVNLFFRPDAEIKYVHTVHYLAWKHGLKALYYYRSDKLRKADKVGQQISRVAIEEIDFEKLINNESCIACE